MQRHISWASDFDSLLSDVVGVELFWSYLEEESLGHLLKFWLAVEGLKKENDQVIISKYVRCILKNFLRSSVVELDSDIENEIWSCLEKYRERGRWDSKIFDRAQESVKSSMLSGAYPNFLKSDIYLNYVQKWNEEDQDSEEDHSLEQKRTEMSESSLPGPEGAENHENGDSQEWNIPKVDGTHFSSLPTLPEESVLHYSSKDGDRSLAKEALLSLGGTRRKNYTSQGASEDFPYHAWGSVYNPVSRQDSELQSCSSGAYTTTDDNYSSYTDLGIVLDKKKSKQKLKLERQRIQDNIKYNLHKEDPRNIIPRPARSGAVPPRPLSPKSFAQILTDRLQNYLDQKKHEKKKFEMLNTKLNHIESSVEGFESDQSILDEHVSRIWKDKTPVDARSPGDLAGRPRSPKGGRIHNKWNQLSCRTLPNFGKRDHGYYDGLQSLSFNSKEFGKSQSVSGYHGNERIKEWINKVSYTSEYSDEDLCQLRSGFKVSPKSSSSRIFPRSKSRSNEHSTNVWSGNSTHQQLQEVNRRLLTTMVSRAPVPTKGTTSSSVTYTFSSEPDGMPYRVKISGHSSKITLNQVKNNLPKLGHYRFYFKTRIDGEPCFEEERDDGAYVPVWSEGKIIVQCRDDAV